MAWNNVAQTFTMFFFMLAISIEFEEMKKVEVVNVTKTSLNFIMFTYDSV